MMKTIVSPKGRRDILGESTGREISPFVPNSGLDASRRLRDRHCPDETVRIYIDFRE